MDFTDDSSLIAGGFADSTVRVWSVTPKKLRKVKSAAGTLFYTDNIFTFLKHCPWIFSYFLSRLEPDWQRVRRCAGKDHGWEDGQRIKDNVWTQWTSVWHQLQPGQVEPLVHLTIMEITCFLLNPLKITLFIYTTDQAVYVMKMFLSFQKLLVVQFRRWYSEVMESPNVYLSGGLQRAQLPSVGHAVFPLWLLFCVWRTWQGSPVRNFRPCFVIVW